MLSLLPFNRKEKNTACSVNYLDINVITSHSMNYCKTYKCLHQVFAVTVFTFNSDSQFASESGTQLVHIL